MTGPSSSLGIVFGWISGFAGSARLQRLVLGAILLNAVVLGLETFPVLEDWAGAWLFWVDEACIGLFALELAAKLAAERGRFFRSGWNVFDFLVVTASLVPAEQFVSVLLMLRVLWLLRLVSAVPSMRMVVQALLDAVPGMTSVAGLLMLMLYISAVVGCDLFGARFPQWFGTLGASMYTLFQVLTLDAWSDSIARPIMEVYPWAWAYFVAFIVFVTMAVLNLFVGVVVNSIQLAGQTAAKDPVAKDPVADEVRALRREVAELTALIKDRAP